MGSHAGGFLFWMRAGFAACGAGGSVSAGGFVFCLRAGLSAPVAGGSFCFGVTRAVLSFFAYSRVFGFLRAVLCLRAVRSFWGYSRRVVPFRAGMSGWSGGCFRFFCGWLGFYAGSSFAGVRVVTYACI